MARSSRRRRGDTQVAQLLAAGHSVDSASKQSGVPTRTIFRWLQDPDFKGQVDQLRAEVWERAASVLGTASTKAAATLGQLLDDKSPWVKLHAARAILELGTSLREQIALEERVAALEQAIGEQKGQGQRWVG